MQQRLATSFLSRNHQRSLLLSCTSSSGMVVIPSFSSAATAFLSLRSTSTSTSTINNNNNIHTRCFSTQPQHHTPTPANLIYQHPLASRPLQPSAPPTQVPMPHHQVVFVRHGQSTWNRDSLFIGWTDTPLTEHGVLEAQKAGQLLREHGIKVDEVHTSLLKRSIKTAWTLLDELGQQHVPVHCHWRLNERSYGALVGKNKKETVAIHGADQVKIWRRSYDVPPPAQDPSDPYYPGNDPKYAQLIAKGEIEIPLTESLKDVKQRAVKHWEEVVKPSIRAGRRVVVVGHENNLRALLMHIDGIAPEDMLHVDLPRAVPLVYQFDEQLQPIKQPQSAPYLSGCFMLRKEELEAIQERDRRQVYDLSLTKNLELEAEKETKQAMKQQEEKEEKVPVAAAMASPSSRIAQGGSRNSKVFEDEVLAMPTFGYFAHTKDDAAAAAAAAVTEDSKAKKTKKVLKSTLSLFSSQQNSNGNNNLQF